MNTRWIQSIKCNRNIKCDVLIFDCFDLNPLFYEENSELNVIQSEKCMNYIKCDVKGLSFLDTSFMRKNYITTPHFLTKQAFTLFTFDLQVTSK